MVWVRENSVDQLELPFSVDAINPWNSKLVTIELSNDVDRKLTDNNKVREIYIAVRAVFK